MALTNVEVDQAVPADKPRKLFDGGGLFLLVQPNGAKYWRMNFILNGTQSTLALGVFKGKGSAKVEMTLKEARAERDERRKLLDRKIDPRDQAKIEAEQRRLEAAAIRKADIERREAGRAARAQCKSATVKAKLTFERVAEEWFSEYEASWTPKHAHQVWQSLRDHAFPLIGAKAIADIGTADVMHILSPMLGDGKIETAGRLRQRMAGIWQYAAVKEYCPKDVVALVAKEFGKIKKTARKANPIQHFAAVGRQELPGLLLAMSSYKGHPITRLALRLLALTFVRTGELRGARWAEFDLESKAPTWSIPAERMKMRRDHVVPLASQAVEALRELQGFTGGGEYLFPHERRRDRPMSENTVLYALWSMGYKGRMTGHGFRAIAGTMLREELGFRHEVVERQLAHEQEDSSARPYDRADYLADRRKMMQVYADLLERIEGEQPGGKVVQMKQRTAKT